jgi:anaerobic selenocysteine-containing dehydrogenase
VVSLDIYVNETSRHADVILPGPSPLEDLHYDVPYPQLSWRNHARYSAPVLQRAPGQPSEWQTLLKLAAIAQGQSATVDVDAIDDAHFAEDARKQFGDQAEAMIAYTQDLKGPDRLLAAALKAGPYGLDFATVQGTPGGIDLGPLMPRLPEVLRTVDGRINLAPDVMLHDLQRVHTELAQPMPAMHQMQVIGRRDVRSNNSWMHNLPLLAKGPMRCTVLVHPDDAARLGLAQGNMAALQSKHGQVQAEVEITDAMMPGVVSLPHGWGHSLPGTQLKLASQRPGANLNALLDDTWRDPVSGNAVLSGMPVVVRAVASDHSRDTQP